MPTERVYQRAACGKEKRRLYPEYIGGKDHPIQISSEEEDVDQW